LRGFIDLYRGSTSHLRCPERCPILELTMGESPSPPRQAKRGAPFSPRPMKTPRRATLAPLGKRGSGVWRAVHYPIVIHYEGHPTSPNFSPRRVFGAEASDNLAATRSDNLHRIFNFRGVYYKWVYFQSVVRFVFKKRGSRPFVFSMFSASDTLSDLGNNVALPFVQFVGPPPR
jgi:hypothetical protein